MFYPWTRHHFTPVLWVPNMVVAPSVALPPVNHVLGLGAPVTRVALVWQTV